MGQPVAVVEKPSSTPGVVRYEANRSLSGQGHDRFESLGDAVGPTSSAEVARRLFGSGQVSAVHVFSNIITVDLLKGRTADGLGDIIRNLYQYWRPGMAPPAFEELVAEEAALRPRHPPGTLTAAAVATRRRCPKRPSGCRRTSSSAAVSPGRSGRPPPTAGRRPRQRKTGEAGRGARGEAGSGRVAPLAIEHMFD